MYDDELQAIIDEFDKDNDGEINEGKFLGIMPQNLPSYPISANMLLIEKTHDDFRFFCKTYPCIFKVGDYVYNMCDFGLGARSGFGDT